MENQWLVVRKLAGTDICPLGCSYITNRRVLDAPRRREIFEAKEKLIVQEIRNITLPRRIVATYDSNQFYCLQSTNVITLRTRNGDYLLKYLLGVLNSEAVNFFFRQKSPGNNHIPSNQLAAIPVPQCGKSRQSLVAAIVEIIIFCSNLSEGTSLRDPLMLAYWDRVLNGLVYELYFQEELNSANLHLFELVHKSVVSLKLKTDSEKYSVPQLRRLFETLYDGSHPVRIALDKLQTLDTVRIIEGKT